MNKPLIYYALSTALIHLLTALLEDLFFHNQGYQQ